MRLQSYLTEGKKTKIELPGVGYQDYAARDAKIIELIKTNCKPFLKQMAGAGTLLYRGAHVFDQLMLEITPRKGRRPKDMEPEYHKIFDSYFKKKFGWKPRTEGVFGTGSFGKAMVYGNVHSMWPIGPFKFLWSDKLTYGDLYLHVKKDLEPQARMNAPAMEAFTHEDLIKALKPQFHQVVNTYKKSNLKNALRNPTEPEIMLLTSSYYLLDKQFDSMLRELIS